MINNDKSLDNLKEERGKEENYSELNEMLEEMESVSELYRPSTFWDKLVRTGIQQLKETKFHNFKRTLNMKYFNWNVLTILAHQFLPIFIEWLKNPNWNVIFKAKFMKSLNINSFWQPTHNAISRTIYKIYVAALWEFVSKCDSLKLLQTLEEPSIGNPFIIQYKGINTSQDLCNSVHEFYSITDNIDTNRQLINVAELGAGYGRLAYIFLKALPLSSYLIIDIPPALYIAQEYLQRVFPGEKLFYFRRFKSYDDVKKEFESSKIRFLIPHQIEQLPPKQIDLFINISSLHEMTYPQIENYLTQIDRLCSGYFYTKQWKKSRAKENDFVIREHEYPIPNTWTTLYHRHHPIQRMFFEGLYKLDNKDREKR